MFSEEKNPPSKKNEKEKDGFKEIFAQKMKFQMESQQKTKKEC